MTVPQFTAVVPTQMHVPVFAGLGELAYVDRPIPHPQAADDVLVAVSACGICGTDLNILATPPAHKARPGIILGHEAVGTVIEIGPGVRRLRTGDRVVVAPRITCGRCAYCIRGLVNQCEDYLSVGTSIDGALAPFLRVPKARCIASPPPCQRRTPCSLSPFRASWARWPVSPCGREIAWRSSAAARWARSLP